MHTVTTFPFETTETPHIWIPMPDGVRLSARIWRPVTDKAVPAILEFLPYRKRDCTSERDALTHPYLAGHGYVCIRVDMRGCGDSEGLFDDEYSPQEMADCIAVLEWLAAQSWCSGDVGMMGISWGGFNGLQVAALAPEPLKAVVSICSTVDRFADDIHYKGGAMLGENVAWAATVLAWFALPPDPQVVGERWREMWFARLENTPFLAERWVEHQSRNAYWQHGSVCEDFSAIKAAVLSVGGWHDGYRNTVGHLVDNLEAPVHGLIGPWNHKYPHFAVPAPRIDFLGEMLRWWDRWLKGEKNDVENLPIIRRWLMDSVPPQPDYEVRPGQWIGDDRSAVQAPLEKWHLVGRDLVLSEGAAARTIHPALFCGQAAGEYFPHGGAAELPDDQRVDDALSCCFELGQLHSEKDIVGAPELRIQVISDTPKAQIAVRLCDVHPDGKSTLITHGFLNLRHREGFERFKDLPAGQVVPATIQLDHCAYRVPAGHSLRVALSSSYWPYIWPEAELTTLRLESGVLELPVRSESSQYSVAFDEPRSAPPVKTEQLKAASRHRNLIRSQVDAGLVLDVEDDTGEVRDPNTGLTMRSRLRERFSINENDPCSAESHFVWLRTMQRDGWRIKVEAEIKMRTDGENFLISSGLKTFENDKEIFEKTWESSVARQ
ncbi:CocE/NonD family hydrolase [Shimia sp.]|uniref:CocE/NonD family hydrolase n=1 Tax=Shimia sp. TaxID=1954381 RepID=UPI003B8AA8DE